MTILKTIHNPKASEIGNNITEFLQIIDGPTIIKLTGSDTSRSRALVTLLHGNEPSGLTAIFQWIKSEQIPAVNIICIIASVKASLTEPYFANRALPEKRDLNRCFKPPFNTDHEGTLAEDILKTLQAEKPEAAIDMHNTSGSGPAFGVATHMDDAHDALTSLFTNRLIVTDLRLGALMEISEHLCPTVTIECGGRLDETAHAIAYEGLQRFFLENDVLSKPDEDFGLELLHNPVRLEINDGYDICYKEENQEGYALALHPNIEQLNSGTTKAGTELGFVNMSDINQLFTSTNSGHECVVNDLVYIENNKLYTKQDLKLFMITTNPVIAKMDCLFYAVKACGNEL